MFVMIRESSEQVWKYFGLICDDIIHDSNLEDFPKEKKSTPENCDAKDGRNCKDGRQNAISKAITRIFEKITEISFEGVSFY